VKTARDHLTDGAARDAITYAAHSVESTLKAILGQGSGVAGDLLRQFADAGFMNDLPTAKARAVSKALGAVAFRTKFAHAAHLRLPPRLHHRPADG